MRVATHIFYHFYYDIHKATVTVTSTVTATWYIGKYQESEAAQPQPILIYFDDVVKVCIRIPMLFYSWLPEVFMNARIAFLPVSD